MKFYIDIDNVVMDFDGIMGAVCQEFDNSKWELSEAAQRYHDDNMEFIYTYMRPLPAELAAITRAYDHDVILLTARPEQVMAITVASLRMYGFDKNIFRSDNKTDFILKRDIENLDNVVFVDDRPSAVQDAISAGINSFLFRRQHNIGVDLPTISTLWEVM